FSFDPDLGDGSSVDPSTGEITGGVAGTTYTLEYLTSGTCPDSSTQTITVLANDDPSFLLVDFCVGSVNSATGIATSGGTFSFNPDPMDGSTVDPLTGSIASGVGGTTYFVQYLTAGVCVDDTTISVTVDDSVYAGVDDTLSFCSNSPADSLFNLIGTSDFSGSWDGPSLLGDGYFGTFDPTANVGGQYTYIVTSNGACPSDTAYINVDVFDPMADFLVSVASGAAPLTVEFTNTSTNATSYFWDLVVSVSTDESPEEIYTVPGEYTIMLIASDAGCSDTAFQNVVVFSDPELIIPNVFSPNGDGMNDLFKPITQGMESVEVLIFNRWGELIMNLSQLNQGWDGRNTAGELVPEGTYYYTVSARGFDGSENNASGFVVLKR
ncbi:MAG TPA: hypothetical protein DCF89_09955, partial [Flavobacteriales bacterium]|nr:hypothetical protein [Flavobacteriales bacterium]